MQRNVNYSCIGQCNDCISNFPLKYYDLDKVMCLKMQYINHNVIKFHHLYYWFSSWWWSHQLDIHHLISDSAPTTLIILPLSHLQVISFRPRRWSSTDRWPQQQNALPHSDRRLQSHGSPGSDLATRRPSPTSSSTSPAAGGWSPPLTPTTAAHPALPVDCCRPAPMRVASTARPRLHILPGDGDSTCLRRPHSVHLANKIWPWLSTCRCRIPRSSKVLLNYLLFFLPMHRKVRGMRPRPMDWCQ
jgi:hypothetical protein